MVRNHAAAGSYVIVHSGVDNWTRGQVVKAGDFKVTVKEPSGEEKVVGDRLERLVSLGAVRPATDAEAAAGRGFVSGVPGLSVASQMRLATLDAEVEALRRLVGDQQDKVNAYAGMGLKDDKAEAATAAEEAALSAVLDERRAEIEGLRQQAAELNARLTALAQKGGAAAQAAPTDPELSGSVPLTEHAEGGGGRRHRKAPE